MFFSILVFSPPPFLFSDFILVAAVRNKQTIYWRTPASNRRHWRLCWLELGGNVSALPNTDNVQWCACKTFAVQESTCHFSSLQLLSTTRGMCVCVCECVRVDVSLHMLIDVCMTACLDGWMLGYAGCIPYLVLTKPVNEQVFFNDGILCWHPLSLHLVLFLLVLVLLVILPTVERAGLR